MPILDNKQVILSYGGGGSPLNVNITPTSLTGNQNSTLFTFTESGSDLGQVSKRVYVFSDESTSQTSNPSYTFTKPGNKKVSAYFYSDNMSKVGYAESNVTIYQPSGYTCDLIANCDICAALTKEASAYTGPLVRLLRESDWQTADIPYNSFETLDTVSATTFLNLPIDDNLTGLPLDIMSPTSSLGLSTFRKLKTSYSGSALRVRRSSDDVERDFGFNGLGYVELSGITNFLTGSTTGFCTTVYNQGTLGSNGDLIQTSKINQPIVDVTTFSYPTLDISLFTGTSGQTLYRNMVARNQGAISSNFNTSKNNLFFKIKGKQTQNSGVLCPLDLNNISFRLNMSNPKRVDYSGILTTGFITNPNYDYTQWALHTARLRLDYPIGNRRYVAFGLNNMDSQKNVYTNLLFRDSTYLSSIVKLSLNYEGSTNYQFNGWFSELIMDNTDLTHNQFYKVKKFMSQYESIPYSSTTLSGLRVMTIYNQKATNQDHYYQNAVSNMPEFRINDSTFNRPSIFSRSYSTGDGSIFEPLYSSMTLDGVDKQYNNQYSFINLFHPEVSNTFNLIKYSSGLLGGIGTQWMYDRFFTNSRNIIMFSLNNNSSYFEMSTGQTTNQLKIDSYRQITSGTTGQRLATIGQYSTSGTTINGVVPYNALSGKKTSLFHLGGQVFSSSEGASSYAYRGRLFFTFNFESVPSINDWNNLIYPSLKSKYNTSN